MKKRFFKRLGGLLLALVMVLSLVPAMGTGLTAKAAENPVYVTLHFYNTYSWEEPAIQYWGGSSTEVTGYGQTGEITGWGGASGYTLVADSANEGWYTITLKGDFTGFQFLDYATPDNNTSGKGMADAFKYCTDSQATDLYCRWSEDTNYDLEWYLDAAYETSIDTLVPSDALTETTMTFHFVNSNSWDSVYAYVTEGGSWSAISGYEDYGTSWPGKEVTADDNGYYTVTVTKDASVCNVIFNNNNGSQTSNICITPTSATEEYYVLPDGTVSTTVPEVSEDDVITEATITMHYQTSWTSCNVYMAEGTGWTAISGYSAANEWPGTSISADSANSGWYTVTVHKDASVFDCIFNNGSAQTDDICITSKASKEEYWVSGVKGSTSVSAEAPEGWVESDANDIYKEDVVTTPRYLVVEYNRTENDYDGWNIYTWNSGYGSSTEIYSQEVNGKHYIIVPVKQSEADMTLGFCMRYTTSDNAWAAKDGGDHYVVIPADQQVVHVVFDQDQGITSTYPYNKGYEMDGANKAISFYYRDDDLVLTDTESSLEKVQLVVNGTSYDMTYDETNERYAYTLTDCASGDYAYYYLINGEKKLDAFNSATVEYEGEECSVLSFKHYDNLEVEASLSQDSMDYNDNNVLTLTLTGDDAENISSDEIASASVDLTELGLGTMAIDTELMAVTISCLNTTTTGMKTLPVTVTDIYGNIYETEASVEVFGPAEDEKFDWDEAVIYFAVTDRFYDGNTDNNAACGSENAVDKDGSLSYHGGDFAGLTQKLDYLKDLGVNTIWITPIVEQSDITTDKDGETIESTGYHGYWASDFTSLNGHLGTEEEFATLISEAHKRGLKLMVDVVVNHAGYNTEDYFNQILVDDDGNYVAMIRNADNTISGDDVYSSLSSLPDFVTENEAVREQLIEWQTNWVEKYGIDYFRVDTVKHVDTTTWAALKNELTEIDPDFKMIGEYSGAGYANTASELGTGTMDSLLDFDFNDQAQKFVTGSLSEVESFMASRNASLNNTATMGAFLSSHDEDGLVYKLINESGMTEDEALAAFKVAASLEITAKGQAVIYYGEELGQYGANDYPYQTNRYDFDWDEAASQANEEDSMLNHYKKLLSIRQEYSKLFARGSRTAVATSDDAGYDVFARSYDDKTLYVALNTKDEQEVTFAVSAEAGATMKDLYSGDEYTVSSDQTVTVNLAAASEGGTAILVETEKKADKPDYRPAEQIKNVGKHIADKINNFNNDCKKIFEKPQVQQAIAAVKPVMKQIAQTFGNIIKSFFGRFR